MVIKRFIGRIGESSVTLPYFYIVSTAITFSSFCVMMDDYFVYHFYLLPIVRNIALHFLQSTFFLILVCFVSFSFLPHRVSVLVAG